MAKNTHIVVHKSLYMRVDGKLQELAEGTQLSLSDKAAKNMVKRGFIKTMKAAKSVTVGEEKAVE